MNLAEASDAELDELERLMNAAWPGEESESLDGWLLRSATSAGGIGVTQRANSIWPERNPSDMASALAAATKWYSARRQPVIFQITRREGNEALEDALDEQRFTKQSETLIMTADAQGVAAAVQAAPTSGDLEGIRIELSDTPSDAWLDLWWSVDGRGGDAEKAVARAILVSAPGIYAQAVDAEGIVVGTARLALVDGWGGVYSMAVHPDFRRRGIAQAVVSALLNSAVKDGVDRFWLLVTAANTDAQALYGQARFAEVARYHYRQAPLRRAPSAC